MNRDEDISSLGEKISSLFNNITDEDLAKSNKLLKTWQYVIGSIKQMPTNQIEDERPVGNHILAHTKLIDYKRGTLLIEADHPGWLQMLQMYKPYVLRGLKKGCPELNIQSLMFRMKGTDYKIKHIDKKEYNENVKKHMQQQIEKQEKMLQNVELEQNNEGKSEKKEIPDELKKIFDQFRSDMLTKNK